jgi:rifampicin phosphotransferase
MEPAASSAPKGAGVIRLTHVRRLDELSPEDAIASGHKAANLGTLVSMGFPVPPGVVVPAGVPDQQLEAAVSEAILVLGDGPVAARSSALAEDLEGASFAGQYETVLSVRGPSALLEAIRRVRETASDERVAVYRQAPSSPNATALSAAR